MAARSDSINRQVIHDPDRAWKIVQGLINRSADTQNDGRGLVKMLEAAIETQAWRCFRHPGNDDVVDYDEQQFIAFVSTPPAKGMGIEPSKLVALVRAYGRDDLAARVLGLMTTAVGDRPGPRVGIVCDTKNSEQQDATYVVARLKRDDQALAADVAAGKISANAAAIKAGIRHRYARIRTDDVTRAVGVLLKCYTAEQIRTALETL